MRSSSIRSLALLLAGIVLLAVLALTTQAAMQL
jgi:hypothetical protein